jgi:pyruvate,orthophosphate dikinase
VTLDVDEALERGDNGDDVVLVRPTTEPDDVAGMIASVAVVTEIGGATSHAAVVSRELGTPCVVGAGVGTAAALAGRDVTVDGSTGEVFEGRLDMAPCSEAENPALAELAGWARDRTGMRGESLESVFAAARKVCS